MIAGALSMPADEPRSKLPLVVTEVEGGHHCPATGRTSRASRRDRDPSRDAVNLHEYQARALLKAAGHPIVTAMSPLLPRAESIARPAGRHGRDQAQYMPEGGKGRRG